jgi:GTP-binding protein
MASNKQFIRNIAIIAHVDHGKTTLVDGLLKQSHTFRANQAEMSQTLIMDSGDQEHERGITITAKQTAVFYQDYKINIIDTPGHADFSGEVERTLNMADGVLLVVDAQEGPMPQTKFVLKKALDLRLTPIVIINKIDKPASRIAAVENEIADLFLELAADDSQLEYPIYYAVARNGQAWPTAPAAAELSQADPAGLTCIFDAIISHIPEPRIDDRADRGLQLLVAALAADSYLGKYAIGKIVRSHAKKSAPVTLLKPSGEQIKARIDRLFTYRGLTREEVDEAIAGDLVAISGIAEANIGDTIASGDAPEALPAIEIEPPTLSIYIGPNTSPFKGREGEFTTSRQIGDRLNRELETNIALQLVPDGLGYKVSGRGELHLSVLIEAMRREGYEMEVGRPEVVYKQIDGVTHEPIEDLAIEVAPEYLGAVSQELGIRRAELINQESTTTGTIRASYEISTAALIGLRSELLTATKGTLIMNSIPRGYRPLAGKYRRDRSGALIAHEAGTATSYALWNSEDRGTLFIGPGTAVYQGMIVGLYNKQGDLDINVCREKQLTNMRSKSSDGAIQLTPHTQMSLEQCLDFLLDDELLEVTPTSLRLRKRLLDPIPRKRAARQHST